MKIAFCSILGIAFDYHRYGNGVYHYSAKWFSVFSSIV